MRKMVPLWLGLCAAFCAGAQEDTPLVDVLRKRRDALDHLRVEFTWQMRNAPPRSDPFESANWDERGQLAVDFQCRALIVRPWFLCHSTSDAAWEADATKIWVDGYSKIKSYDPKTQIWSVSIDKKRSGLYGPVPLLTIFEMQVCDIQEGVLDLLERGELHIESETAGQIELVGRPTVDGQSSLWSVRATLDKSRGCMPLALHAEMPHGPASTRKIKWDMRVIHSKRVANHDAIAEAVFALDNDIQDYWQIYHFVASSIVRDDRIAKADLAFSMPDRSLRLLDFTTGHVREIDQDGKLVQDAYQTSQEVEQGLRALEKTRLQAVQARELRARREQLFYWIIIGSALTIILAGGGMLWRRHRRARCFGSPRSRLPQH